GLQGLARQLVGVGVGLAEDLGVLDVVEGGGRDLAVDQFHAQSLEGTLTDVNAPNAWLVCHALQSPQGRDGGTARWCLTARTGPIPRPGDRIGEATVFLPVTWGKTACQPACPMIEAGPGEVRRTRRPADLQVGMAARVLPVTRPWHT